MIDAIRDSEFETKEDFLFHLQNDLGCNDLKVCYSYTKNDGSIGFSRWISFLELQHYGPDETVPVIGITKKEFICKASHRTVLDIEVMIDIDEAGRYKSIKNKAKNICRRLRENNIAYSCYFTGSKSYHISILMPGFRFLPDYDVREIKQLLFRKIGSDLQKSSKNTMIALEGEVHYKSKVKKEEASV